MDKLKLIYNPYSGSKTFKNELDVCVRILQKGGYEVSLFRTEEVGDIDEHLKEVGGGYDVILASGGDGTANIVLNAMMKHDIDAAFGIIPSGTANDFASYLGLSGLSIEEVCGIFVKRIVTLTDIGLANDRYFINVCGGGLLTQISQSVDPNLKNILGKLSYYIESIVQSPNFYPIPLKITNSTDVIEESVYLFLVLNSPGAGSIQKIVESAKITDGKFNFFAIKAKPLNEMAKLLVNILKSEHLDDPAIIHFADSYMKIEVMSDEEQFKVSDVDGEDGPPLPLEIKVIPKAIRLLTKDVHP